MVGLSLFRKDKRRDWTPTGPPGRRVYAVGDIHGRLDLLTQLLDKIDAHIRAEPSGDHVLVFLGDLIDRGPNSKEVVELLATGALPGQKRIVLKGNHEDALMRGLNGDSAALTQWLGFGGYECAQSYGVEVGGLFGRSPEVIESVLAQAVPRTHQRFLESLPDSARFGDYLFVHAGLRPGVALEDQEPHDMRWIRKEFLESDFDFGVRVVHGHSISPDVVERANRVCIDTGAYQTGVLTAFWAEGERYGFIKTASAA